MNEASLFAAALEKREGAERQAFLDEACAGDTALRQRVEHLLAADRQSAGVLERGPAGRDLTDLYQPIAERPGTLIGPYKLMEQIGEGGMGLVFVAEQQQPVRRRVALKIIKPGMDSMQVIARFEAERQALAMMDHQNIAKVLDAGTTTSGRPYFVMELVHGVPIIAYCDANQLTPRQRLELFIPVCQAIQHAHQKGIIHRDIKPSNILVTMYDDKPVPKVIDFGVAKAIEQRLTEKTIYTQFGMLVGTFEYMSPEQAEMNAFGVDTRSDIYSLGVLLYELLTGTTPLEPPRLREAAFGEIVRLIKEEEPPRPSMRLSTSGALAKVAAARNTEPAKLSRLVRGELDCVVMKCLEKNRTRRYESASSLARDVERYLKDEPVEARPPSAWYRFGKLARRNKVALTTAALVAAALILGTAVSIWQAIRASEAEGVARLNERDAVDQKRTADEAKHHAEKRGDELAALNATLRRANYVSDMNLARVAWDENNLVRTHELLDKYLARPGEADLRNFEWHYLRRLLHGDLLTVKAHEGWVTSVAFLPDGKSLLTSGTDLPPQGMGALEHSTGQVKLWDSDTGKALAFELNGLGHKLDRVALSNDGTYLVASCWDQAILLWNLATGERATLEGPPQHRPSTFRFSRDGKRLVSIHSPDDLDATKNSFSIRIWDLATRKAVVSLDQLPWLRGGIFSPDRKQLAICVSSQGLVRVLNAATGEESYHLKYGDGYVMNVAFSPDGRRLFACGDKGIRIWDAASHESLAVWQAATSVGMDLTFSPDGKRLALAGVEGVVYLWDTATGQVVQTFKHSGGVNVLAFHPDGSRLATGGRDGTVRIWGSSAGREPRSMGEASAAVEVPELSPDGKTYLGGWTFVRGLLGRSSRIQLWDTSTAKPRGNAIVAKHMVGNVAWSEDSTRLYLADEGKTVTIVDVASGEIRGSYELELDKGSDGMPVVAFSPNEKWCAHSAPNGTIQVCNAQTGTPFRSIKGLSAQVHNLEFNADGTRLASAEVTGVVKIWNVETGSEVAGTKLSGVYVHRMRFSPDTKLIAAVGYHERLASGEVRILDAESGFEILSLRGHTLNVTDCVFSAEGQRLATASADKTIRLWDLATGQEVLKLGGYTDFVSCIRFSADGRQLIGASMQRNIRVWDASPLPE
jgi:WD40 repeat protein/serine/threonine protein kinase